MGIYNNGASIVAPHPTIANLWVRETDALNSNLILTGYCNGAPDTTADTYAHGCTLIRLDSGTGNKALYENVGSSAVPSWNLIGDVTAEEISLANGKMLVGNSSGVAEARRHYGAVAFQFNGGTTPGSIFGAQTWSGSLTGLKFVTGTQGNAGTITVKVGGTTVAIMTSIAGQGSCVGSEIAETAFSSAALVTVESGNANQDGTLWAAFITGAV